MIDFTIYAVTMIAVWAVVAVSLNLQFGLTGLVNFGQILPFAIGAYAAAIMSVHVGSWWLAPLVAVICAPALGILVVWPARRLAQDYWALITLGAAEIFRLIMLNFPSIAGGIDGATVQRIGNPLAAMLAALSLLVLVLAAAQRIASGPFGRMLRVIREDETLAATLGRDVFSFQLRISAVTWMIAALAGVLYAHIVGYVAPTSFMVTDTFIIWTAIILGGSGSNLGAILGTAAIQLTGLATRFAAQWTALPADLLANLRLAAFGLILVLVFLYRPHGLLPERKRVVDAQHP